MTSIAFVLLAAVAVAAALAFLLIPLITAGARRAAARKRLAALDELEDELPADEWMAKRKALRRELEESAPQRPWALIIALVLIIPASALLLYRAIGTPDGLDPPAAQETEVRGMLNELAARARRNPEDAEAWTALGMLWKDLENFSAAEAALRRVARLQPDNPFVQVELAEIMLYTSGQRRLPDEARELLRRATQSDPSNQKARWLLGIDAFQRGDHETALSHWTDLEAMLEEGPVREQIRQQIQRARMEMAHAGMEPGAVPESAEPEAGQGSDDAAAGLTVRVRLAESLADAVTGNETVFVFARAAQGPPMPLAVKRLQADNLPAEITLTDADGMAEGLRLSAFDEVIITARISATGNATAQSGDLEGRSDPIASNTGEPVAVTIDHEIQ